MNEKHGDDGGNPGREDNSGNGKPGGHGNPQYILNIDGNEFPWDKDTITTEQIAELGGWGTDQGVIEVDNDNNERTLSPNEVVHIKPGHGFGKKHKWKRG